MNRCGSFLFLSAPLSLSLFSIWTDLKRSEKIPEAPTWRWGEWIWLIGPSRLHQNSPQGCKYQFYQGFWSDQRSGNPNHSLPPFYIHHHHQIILPKGRSLTSNSGTMAAVLLKGRSCNENLGTQAAVSLGMDGCSFFPHPTLSLACEQTLKDLKRSQGHQLGG